MALALSCSLGSIGCDRDSTRLGARDAPSAVGRQSPEPGAQSQEPGEAPPSDNSPEAREQRYRKAVLGELLDNPKLGRLIERKPVLGGTWRVGNAEDVKFLGSGKIAIDYEDGHAAGRLTVHVKDPHDLTTWEVLKDEPE